jgi:hypothetical protein
MIVFKSVKNKISQTTKKLFFAESEQGKKLFQDFWQKVPGGATHNFTESGDASSFFLSGTLREP